MKGRTLLLLGAVVLLAAIWFMVGSSTEASSSAWAGPTSRFTAAERTEGSDPEAAEFRTEPAELERSAVATPKNDATDKLYRIQVIHNETRQPVPGAEVSWYESFSISELDAEEQDEYRKIRGDLEKLARRYGTTVMADARGLVLVPVATYVRAAGRHGALYGELNLRPDPENEGREFELELERDLTLSIRVLDSLGQPAVAVPVGILPAIEGGVPRAPHSLGASAAPDGELTAPHLQIEFRHAMRTAPYSRSYLVRPMIPGLTEGGIQIDARQLPAEPVLLQLPPTGRVNVRTTGPQGADVPRPSSINATLAIAPLELPAENARYRAPPGHQWRGSRQEQVTVFDRVVAGQKYLASSSAGLDAVHKLIVGPLAEGDEVSVTLELASHMYLLVGRLLDEQREPLRNIEIEMTYRTDMSSGGGMLRTDGDGCFELDLHQQGTSGRELLRGFTIGGNRRGDSRAAGLVYFLPEERTLAPGENDLGDIIMTRGPLVATGRLLEDGVPVSGNPRIPLIQVRPVVDGGWGNRDLKIMFLEEGRFEIRGRARSDLYRLTVTSLDHLPFAPIEFAPGADGLEINLLTGGSLRSTVQVDGAVLPTAYLPGGRDLLLRLIPTEGQDLADRPHMLPFDNRLQARDGGTGDDGLEIFRWAGLWPGAYRLEVLPRGAAEPLLQIDNVHIESGADNRDPRLEGIDLRGKLRTITVDVRDPTGHRIPEGRFDYPVVLIQIQNRSPTAVLEGYRAGSRPAVILTGARNLDLIVVAPGYYPKEVLHVAEDTTVTLEPHPEVVFRIAGGMPVLPEGHALTVTIENAGPQPDQRRLNLERAANYPIDAYNRARRRGQFDDNGQATVQFESDGIHSLSVSVMNSPARQEEIQGIEPAEVELHGSLGRQVFEVHTPAQELNKALERLAQRRL